MAPYQCATSKNERPLEDTAPKALWILSERFEKEGDGKARETTLRQIVDQYPDRVTPHALAPSSEWSPRREMRRWRKSSAERAEAGEDTGDE